MIDAYTIGVTLALNNGVADGIAAIRRDLASLDRAVQASAAGLAQLRARAGGSVAGASADLSRMLENARRAAAALPKPAETQAAEPPQALREREVPTKPEAPWVRRTPALAPASPADPLLPPAPVPRPAPAAASPASARTVAPGLRADPPSEHAPTRSRDEPAPRVVTVPVPAAPRPSAAAASTAPAPQRGPEPPAVRGRETMPRPHAPSAAPAIDYAALGRTIVPRTVPEAAPSPTIRRIEHTRTETNTTIIERGTALPPIPIPIPLESATPVIQSAPARPAAPPAVEHTQAPARPARAQPEPRAPAAPPPRLPAAQEDPRSLVLPKAVSSGLPSAARTQPNPRHASATVEVVLDGAAIGRWMDQRLARAATRPPSGITGFDPRLSPIWTTVPVAN